jgi:RimJ/RimL family protein N-acetyltransferase
VQLKSGDILLLDNIPDEDAGRLADLADDPIILKNLASHSFPHPYTREAALDFIHLNREMFRKRFRFDFYIHYKDDLCGVIEISDINYEDRNAHVGYWVGSGYRGKGIATESLRLVCGFALASLKMHKLHTRVLSFNIPSMHVLVSNGFYIEGYLRDQFYLEGKYYGLYSMARILDDVQ